MSETPTLMWVTCDSRTRSFLSLVSSSAEVQGDCLFALTIFVDVRELPLMLQPMVQLVLRIVFQEALLIALPFVLLQVLL